MKEYTVSDIKALIQRAFSLTKESDGMVFVGIYSAETYKPLALADREHVQINVGKEVQQLQTRPVAVEINASQIQAILKHIRTPDNPLTHINIAKLRFLCLSHDSLCMTGKSSFNMDTKRVSIADINKSVFRIIHKHYTSQDLLAEEHALQISAIIKEKLIIVGMHKEEEEEEDEDEEESSPKTLKEISEKSCLKILEAIFEKPNETDINRNTESYAQEPFIEPEVALRCSSNTPEEKRKVHKKKELPVLEDSSIGALGLDVRIELKDDLSDKDDSPLIENIESIDMCIDRIVSFSSEK